MDTCVFCKIIAGKLDCAKIWEDDEFVAFLDINPNTKGMTVVIPKNHYDSYVIDMLDDLYSRFFLSAKNVAKILEKGLDVRRVALVMEGLMIDHAHIKLYPLHGIQKKFEEILSDETVYFEKYEGYISTRLGPPAEMGGLKKLAGEIKEKSK